MRATNRKITPGNCWELEKRGSHVSYISVNTECSEKTQEQTKFRLRQRNVSKTYLCGDPQNRDYSAEITATNSCLPGCSLDAGVRRRRDAPISEMQAPGTQIGGDFTEESSPVDF